MKIKTLMMTSSFALALMVGMMNSQILAEEVRAVDESMMPARETIINTDDGRVVYHKPNISTVRPEAMPMGPIGGGETITGYDKFGNAIVKKCGTYSYPSCP